jgi:tRNA threonylcarbamoyladenosine biosynthesis protein TsaB
VKGLGLALDKPVLPVPTVDSLACGLYGTDRVICPLMDARRQQVYTGIYENKDGLRILEPQCVTALTEITGKLNELGREVIFLGDGVPVNEEALRDEMKVPYLIAPAHLNRQRAASTAVRAAQIYAEKGEEALVSADDFRPEYLRVPQAERERGDKRNYKVFV